MEVELSLTASRLFKEMSRQVEWRNWNLWSCVQDIYSEAHFSKWSFSRNVEEWAEWNSYINLTNELILLSKRITHSYFL
jgi:hypothetical protein